MTSSESQNSVILQLLKKISGNDISKKLTQCCHTTVIKLKNEKIDLQIAFYCRNPDYVLLVHIIQSSIKKLRLQHLLIGNFDYFGNTWSWTLPIDFYYWRKVHKSEIKIQWKHSESQNHMKKKTFKKINCMKKLK